MEQSGVDVPCGAGGGAVGTGVDVGVEEEKGDAAEDAGGSREECDRRGERREGFGHNQTRERRNGGARDGGRRERKQGATARATAKPAAPVVAPGRGQRGIFPPDGALEHGPGLAGGSLGGAFGHGGR